MLSESEALVDRYPSCLPGHACAHPTHSRQPIAHHVRPSHISLGLSGSAVHAPREIADADRSIARPKTRT
eukprot:2190360-Rhodomonas_salina.3